MELSPFQLLEVIVAITAVLMLGYANIRMNLTLFGIHTGLLACVAACIGYVRDVPSLFVTAAALLIVKAIGAPWFLRFIIRKVDVQTDSGLFIAPSVSMHIGIILLGVSYMLARGLPGAYVNADATYGAAAALSLIFDGILMMVTRRSAMSQIIGFLVIENGIFLFTLVKTHAMPMSVEMGILLDVLVGVMIAGMLLFRIQKSFEHIDVTKLTELKD